MRGISMAAAALLIAVLGPAAVMASENGKSQSRDGATRFVDLSHTIQHGMTTYKGLPPPTITDFLSREASRKNYAPGTEFSISTITMVANTGTYLDTPFHRYEGGKDLAQLDLAYLADLQAVVIRATNDRAITPQHFANVDVRGKAVLIHTGWDRHWGTDTYQGESPYLTAAAAKHLVDGGAVVVGIDSRNIDDTRDAARPVHTALLAAEIPIIEHLCNLQALPPQGFRFFAVPVKVQGMGTFPVRAFAVLDDSR